MLQTIRAKLVFLLCVVLLGTASLGYLLISNTIKAKLAVEKVQTADEIAKQTDELIIHIREHQITFNPKAIEDYNKSNTDLLEHVKELGAILNKKENILLLAEIKKTAEELKNSTDERFALITKYASQINTPEFAQTPDGKRFETLTNQGHEIFAALLECRRRSLPCRRRGPRRASAGGHAHAQSRPTTAAGTSARCRESTGYRPHR